MVLSIAAQQKASYVKNFDYNEAFSIWVTEKDRRGLLHIIKDTDKKDKSKHLKLGAAVNTAIIVLAVLFLFMI